MKCKAVLKRAKTRNRFSVNEFNAGQKTKDVGMDIYRALYSAERKVGGGEGNDGVYGTVTKAGTIKVMGVWVLHTAFDETAVLMDAGSGLGRPLVHAAVVHGVRGIGVEYDKIKCYKCSALVSLLEANGSLAPAGRPKIICDSILNVPSIDPATHVYANYEGWPVQFKEALGKLFAASSTAKAVTVVQRAFHPIDPVAGMMQLGFGSLILISSFTVSLAGGRGHLKAYCFVKGHVPGVTTPSKANLETMAAYDNNIAPGANSARDVRGAKRSKLTSY